MGEWFPFPRPFWFCAKNIRRDGKVDLAGEDHNHGGGRKRGVFDELAALFFLFSMLSFVFSDTISPVFVVLLLADCDKA